MMIYEKNKMINFTKGSPMGKEFIIRFPMENLFLYIKVIAVDQVMTNSAIIIFATIILKLFFNVRKLFFLLLI